jgi:hypothetical protein
VNDSSSYLGALVCLAALGYGGYWYYTENEASAGMSGKKFYETCWEYKSKGGWGLAFGEAKPSNPYQAAQWMNCETVTVRGMLAAGIIFAEVGEESDPLRRACPYSRFPLVGKYHLYVQETEAAGGVSGLSAFLHATWSVGSWAKKYWPNCSSERVRQEYSKIVEKTPARIEIDAIGKMVIIPGVYMWEKPCPKCK